jgi:ACS family allantoate permease-like MFS transporter
MLSGLSCGDIDISLGKSLTSPTNTTTNMVSSNHLPWSIIGICFLLCTVVFFSIRVLLARENKRRDAEPPDNSYDDVYVARIDEEGNRVEVKVSKVGIRPQWELQTGRLMWLYEHWQEFLDLTDRQNRDFRYVL